jgi:hypothetical protein
MKPLPHTYDVQLAGGPEGHATLTVAGLPDVRSAPPLAFDGPGDDRERIMRVLEKSESACLVSASLSTSTP